jgi:hypothetical protein
MTLSADYTPASIAPEVVRETEHLCHIKVRVKEITGC